MELFLFGGAALAAFLAVAGPVLLWAAHRRAATLQRALAEALTRIAELEAGASVGAQSEGLGAFAFKPQQQAPIAPRETPPLDQSSAHQSVVAQEAAPTELRAPPPLKSEPFKPPEPFFPKEPREHVSRESFSPAHGDARQGPPQADSAAPQAYGHILTAAFTGLVAVGAIGAARFEVLSPAAGIVLAFLAGLAALGGAEWLYRARAQFEGAKPPLHQLAALTAFGLFLLMSAAAVGAGPLRALPPEFGFGVFALAAFAGIAWSLIYGPALLGFGLVAALAAPALTPLGPDAAVARHLYLVLVMGTALFVGRRRGAPIWIWMAGFGALAWGLMSVVAGPEVFANPLHVAAAGAYLTALAATGLAYAWTPAQIPLPFPEVWRAPPQRFNEAFIAGASLSAMSGLLLAALFARSGEAAPISAFYLVACVAMIGFAAAYAEAFAALALAMAGLAAAALALWPNTEIDAVPILLTAAALTLAALIAGWFAIARARNSAPGAALAALAPVAFLVGAYTRLTPAIAELGGAQAWIGAAFIIAVLNALFYVRLRGPARDAGACEAFLIGACLALTAALGFAAPPPWTAWALAAAPLLCALADRALPHRAFRIAAIIAAAALLARLATDIAASPPAFAFAPWLSPIAPPALLAALSFYASAFLFMRGGRLAASRAAQGLEAAAYLLLAGTLSIAARHLASGGALTAPYASLVEMGVHTLIWLSLAALIAALYAPAIRSLLGLAEVLAFALAIAHALIGAAALLNPWWGLWPAATPAWPVFNALAFGYAAPAAGFIAYAWLRARAGSRWRADLAGIVGILLAVLWLVLELRRAFHPQNMAASHVAMAEGWTILLALVAAAALGAALYNRRLLAEAAGAMPDPNLLPPK